MEVCGIDPGLETSGYAIVSAGDGGLVIRDAGVCRTDTAAELPDRLAQIEADFSSLFAQWPVDLVAVEQLYAHYKHPRTAILMGHARGVIMAVAARNGCEISSLAATQVKRFMTGNGRASKAQVQRAVMVAYGLPSPPEPNDVADALAMAMCCAHNSTSQQHKAVRA